MSKNSNPGLFSDLGKKSSDLLNKDFPDKPKVEVKTKIGDVETNLTLQKNPDGSVFGSFNPKYKFKTYGGITIGGLLDTKRTGHIEAVAEKPFAGGKLTFKGFPNDESLLVEGEYKHDIFSVAGSANVLGAKGTKLDGSLVVGMKGFSAGIQTEYLTDKINKINGTLAYATKDYNATFYTRITPKDSSNLFGVTWYQSHNNGGAYSIDGNYDPSKQNATPKITLGASYPLDSDSIAKGKFDTTGRVGLSYAVKFNKFTRFVLGSSINVQNFSAPGEHTLGFSLTFD